MYTFPDETELNGAIAEFNRLAKARGAQTIPFSFQVKNHFVYRDEYLQMVLSENDHHLPLPTNSVSYVLTLTQLLPNIVLPPGLLIHFFSTQTKKAAFAKWVEENFERHKDSANVKRGTKHLLDEVYLDLSYHLDRGYRLVQEMPNLQKGALTVLLADHLERMWLPLSEKMKSMCAASDMTIFYNFETDFEFGIEGGLFARWGDENPQKVTDLYLTLYHGYYHWLKKRTPSFRSPAQFLVSKELTSNKNWLGHAILQRRAEIEDIVSPNP
ncbi:MAG: hypothetical protein AB7N80_14800 [Bdellovibrionales bacterium]